METADFTRLVAWSRYLHAAEMQRRHYYDLLKAEDESAKGINWDARAFLSAWYASLWVAFQGWRSLELADDFIEELLDGWPEQRDALRMAHGTVFQFNSEVPVEKLGKLSQDPKLPVWVTLLHDEFQRFLWERIDQMPGTDDQKRQIRKSIASLTGWTGEFLAHARADKLNDVVRESERTLRETADPSSAKAAELRAAIDRARKLASEGPATHRTYREELLRKLNE